MSRIPRVLQRIFGSTPGTNQIGQFGSFAAGSPAYSTDIGVIQSLSNWLTGWYAAVVGANSPALQDLNAQGLVFSQQLANIFQDGVPLWDATTTYYKGSLVQSGTGLGFGAQGLVYLSLTDTNLNGALTDSSKWRPVVTPAAPQVIVGTAPYCTHASLAAAVADSNVGNNIDVLVTSDQTLGAVTHLTKNGWIIRGNPGVGLYSSGGGVGGLSVEATRIELHNLRFANFTTAVTGNASWTYGRVMNCDFSSCTNEVDDSNSPAGQKPVTLGNITE